LTIISAHIISTLMKTSTESAADLFSIQHTRETTATAATLWNIIRDVPGWRRWNAGIEHVELEGPFASGTWFTMKPPGQDAFRSRLLEVREGERFVDETRVEDLVVTVDHRLERAGANTRVTYALRASGPGASEIGPAIAADFPEVLAALCALAEQQP
jgi:hypothetical protein